MKRTLFFLLPIAVWMFAVNTAHATPPINSVSAGVRVGFFYGALAPYGEWIEFDDGFYAWRPSHVRVGWRPYLEGRWVWTDNGWYWVSYEPFGWATFHYGRWHFDEFYGWVWVPNDVWGPAWVEWRYNDDYIGWAPLPPYANFSITVGIRFTHSWAAPAHYWNFVTYGNFGRVIRYRDVVSPEYTRRLIRTTRSIGGYEVNRDLVINRGVDRSFVERRGGIRLERVDVREARDRRGEQIVREGNLERVEVFRPSQREMEQSPERVEAKRGERRLSLDMDRIERPRSNEIKRSEQEERGTKRQTAPNEFREQRRRERSVAPIPERGKQPRREFDTPFQSRRSPSPPARVNPAPPQIRKEQPSRESGRTRRKD